MAYIVITAKSILLPSPYLCVFPWVSCACTVDGGVVVYVCFSLLTVNTKTVCRLCQQGGNHQPYRWLANQYFHSQHSKTSEPSPATRLMSLFACQIHSEVMHKGELYLTTEASAKNVHSRSFYEITRLMSDTLQWYCFSYLHHLILVHFCPIFLQQAHKLKYVTGEERQEVSSKTEPEIVTGLWAVEHAETERYQREVRDVPLHR